MNAHIGCIVTLWIAFSSQDVPSCRLCCCFACYPITTEVLSPLSKIKPALVKAIQIRFCSLGPIRKGFSFIYGVCSEHSRGITGCVFFHPNCFPTLPLAQSGGGSDSNLSTSEPTAQVPAEPPDGSTNQNSASPAASQEAFLGDQGPQGDGVSTPQTQPLSSCSTHSPLSLTTTITHHTGLHGNQIANDQFFWIRVVWMSVGINQI